MPVSPPTGASPEVYFNREANLERLASEHFDLLVVGGGVTGCGVALDAATRGLRTALVEARDFGSGTSSRSSKMIHGGLRYLQQHDYRLVYEALHERQRLLRNAPHLVKPLPFMIPLFGRAGAVSKNLAKAYSSALWIYDVTGGWRIGRRHRRIGAEEAVAHFPALNTERLVAAFVYWDAQADDARITLALARSAAARGAAMANYSPVTELIEAGGQVAGARLASGAEVHAERVVNATGVWSAEVARLARTTTGADPLGVTLRPAKGVHVTVLAARLACDYASVLSVPGDRRSVFVVPWAGYTYIGTTDTDYDGPLEEPRCGAADIDYLLQAVNAWTGAGLTPADVTGSWAGLRPLVDNARSARTADLSRRHRVIRSANGLVSVTGGKLTTYRKMAADTVDAATSRRSRGPTGGTRRLALVGGDRGGRPAPEVLTEACRLGLSAATLDHLTGRYGTETAALVDLCRGRPDLTRPLSEAMPYIRAEVVHAARCEMALTLGDVLSRRMRAQILDRAAAAAAAPETASLLAGELGWDDSETAAQLTAFMDEVDAETRAGHADARPAGG